jgi:hypothetical protein
MASKIMDRKQIKGKKGEKVKSSGQHTKVQSSNKVSRKEGTRTKLNTS